MLNLYRRHLEKCPHRAKGQTYVKCSCPIWCDGELNGRRYRHSLGLRDWQRAVRKLAALETPGAREPKSVPEAIAAFHEAKQDLAHGSKLKTKRVVRNLEELAARRGLRDLEQVGVEDIDALRTTRKICPLTWSKELAILRHFFRFCIVRKWVDANPAAEIAIPKGSKPTEKEPYTHEDVIKILAACDGIGRGHYERLRARAMVLTLRYTALRISDVALLQRDRIRNGEIHLHTLKNGKPVRLPVHPELQAALDIVPLPRGADGPECRYFFWSGNGTPGSMVRDATRTLTAVFRASGVPNAHAHRFRHTLATEILERGGTFEDAAEILGNTAAIIAKHYAKWSPARQERITNLMRSVVLVRDWYTPGKNTTSGDFSVV